MDRREATAQRWKDPEVRENFKQARKDWWTKKKEEELRKAGFFKLFKPKSAAITTANGDKKT